MNIIAQGDHSSLNMVCVTNFGRPSVLKQDSMNGKDLTKASFLSIIRKSKINQYGTTKYVEFEIANQFKLPSTKVEKEKNYKWSVWKRYSESRNCTNSYATLSAGKWSALNFHLHIPLF